MSVRVIQGDARDVLPTLAANSIDACVTDPPYHLTSIVERFGSESAAPAQFGKDGAFARASRGFMGKQWDGGDIAFQPDTWRAVWRVLKPGAHMLVFGGSRTFARMFVAIEDAGFEYRDTLCWLYGTGFPKSADVSKHIDRQTKERWLKMCNAIDNLDRATILDAWIGFSNDARCAGLRFAKSETGTGTNTPRNASVPEYVQVQANHENSLADAIIAELRSSDLHHTVGVNSPSAPSSAEQNTMACSGRAANAERSFVNLGATQTITASSVRWPALDSRDVSTSHMEVAGEALMTWFGSERSSKQAATTALCVALTDSLKRITLSQCATFRSLDTKSQTECVSAISATITESTAVSLISFTADTLKAKAIDKAAGAEREVVGVRQFADGTTARATAGMAGTPGSGAAGQSVVTAPATPEAARWQGWGTALKPAFEPIILARKPLAESTIAANVLAHGTGAINIDASRIAASDKTPAPVGQYGGSTIGPTGHNGARDARSDSLGRWPANVLHDGSPEVEAAFAAYGDKGGGFGKRGAGGQNGVYSPIGGTMQQVGFGDSGTAARFFYSAKADAADRATSKHPTVKPVDLMRWLVRLITPPGGCVLDPFAGSGSTGEAAMLEGFDCTLIEREAEYAADIALRIKRWSGADMPLFSEVA